MPSIEKMVTQLQQGNHESFKELREQFKPLIYSWLKKTHQLHTSEKEDYLSQAYLILWECIQSYDHTKGVAFASYYKIKLYHWYGNQMQKKKLQCVALEEASIQLQDQDHLFRQLWTSCQLQIIEHHLKDVSQEEKKLFHALVQDKSMEELARDMQLTKKTVQNKKYALLKKIRMMLRQDNYSLKPPEYQGIRAAKE